MNTELEKVREDIDSAVDTVTIDIPVRVEATCYGDAPFKFQVSIDEVGQIVLTPESKDVEFINANTESTVDYEIPIIEQQTETIIEDKLTTIKTSIVITAHILAESDNHNISAVVDDIGQVVIYPLAKENSFVTATYEDSLNLITEGYVKSEKYCDYTLMNPGNGWYIRSPFTGGIIGQSIESLRDAKIFVCEQEINRLSKMNESLEETPSEEVEEQSEEDVTPQVDAEVIEESVTSETPVEFSFIQVQEAIKDITNNFQEKEGIVKADLLPESEMCRLILKEHYDIVTVENKDGFYLISFATTQLTEDLSEENRLNLINKFMQGEIPLFSDSGKPNESYVHIHELDSNGYSYYFDEESYAIVSYPEV